MMPVVRGLLIAGVVLIVLAGLVYLAYRANLPLGRLPGDIRWQSGGMTCMIPLATSILLSLVLTVLLNIIIRFLNR